MAYLHCHNCNWGQDDFWDFKINWKGVLRWKYRAFGYNLLSLILEDIATYIRPRRIEFDSYYAERMGWKTTDLHSWSVLSANVKHHFLRLFKQKWWTHKSFILDHRADIAKCPKCGSSSDFDID